ncbi:MAG: RsmE family RNA methyltransferase [Cyanobacteria bacterium]|nr:RsmE family RNA methyltransferase [Cyanobacteriota bacterium]MDA1019961.1 RsmE family RNA methyltransferase [Cyanobacteriota bacterium]
MRNYRFTIAADDQLDTVTKRIRVLNADLLHQVNNVVRLKPGHKEELSMIDGSGKVFHVTMLEASKQELLFEINQEEESQRELNCQYCFYIPVIKPEAFAFMLRKLVELGVQKFVPVIFSRSQKQYIEAIKKQGKRFEKIIQEATEQCEGAKFAELTELIYFDDIKASSEQNYFANERLANQEAANSSKKSCRSITLLVGPEGGLTEPEVEHLTSIGFEAKGLGPRLLMAETAAIAMFCSL